jgi:serine/threonine protein phosphatase PrpC
MKFFMRSTAGIKGVNQDALAIPPKGIDLEKYGICLAIADGITLCPKGGEVASEAVKVVELYYKEAVATQPGVETLNIALERLWENFFLKVHNENDSSYLESGSTLTIALIFAETIHVRHLGDSHCDIALPNGEFIRLTEEHNSPEGYLLNYFGGELETQAQENSHPFPKGSLVLLTTDGVNFFIDTEAMYSLVKGLKTEPKILLDELFEQADAHGSTDDKSVIFGY